MLPKKEGAWHRTFQSTRACLRLSTCPVPLTSRLLAITFLLCPVSHPSSSLRFPANKKQTSDPAFLVMGR